jgi:hypothetical protein
MQGHAAQEPSPLLLRDAVEQSTVMVEIGVRVENSWLPSRYSPGRDENHLTKVSRHLAS